MGDIVDDARDRLRPLLERDSPGVIAEKTVEIDPDMAADEFKRRLCREFDNAPGCVRIAVYSDNRLIGTTTRALVCRPDRMAGWDVGDADRADFPLSSSEYVALRFQCVRQSCTAVAYASFYDERTNPTCPDHAGAPMRLVHDVPRRG